MKNIFSLICSISIICSINVESASAMDSQTPSEYFPESQKKLEVFSRQCQKVKDYISHLTGDVNLVFGVSSQEEGVERFDESWVFVDITYVKDDNRSLTLNFNDPKEMQALADNFPDTFYIIAVDAEVPTYFNGFGLIHLKAIHGALKMDGQFYLPWQYAIDPDNQDMNKWFNMTPESALLLFSQEQKLATRNDMLDPVIRLPEILGSGQNTQLNQRIVNEICHKNQIPVLKRIFGNEGVEILEKRELPFPENAGRLTKPPYVTVFRGEKKFPSANIILPVPEPTEEELSTYETEEKVEVEYRALAIKTLCEQIYEAKKNLQQDVSPSLVFVVDETEEFNRFDKSWIKIVEHYLVPEILQIIAKKFPHSFARIVFDVEASSILINQWKREYFDYLYAALKPGGVLTLPIHYEWSIDYEGQGQSLSKVKKNLENKIKSSDILVFKSLLTPRTFNSVLGIEKSQDTFKFIDLMMQFNHYERTVDGNFQLTEFVFKKAQDRNIKHYSPNIELTEPVIELINKHLGNHIFNRTPGVLQDALEQYFLEPERKAFIQKFNTEQLIPHTVSFLENIFGEGQIKVSDNKNLPFPVVQHRQTMDYVVFNAYKK